MSPGTWTVRATGQSKSAVQRIALPADSIHTIVVLDDHGRLILRALDDAAGSTVQPGGGAATGFGGTAPRPAPSPRPWLVTAAAGLALALAGGSRLIRPRLSHHRRPGRSWPGRLGRGRAGPARARER
jgi:hypothetical protein